jgi:hypothetical protein
MYIYIYIYMKQQQQLPAKNNQTTSFKLEEEEEVLPKLCTGTGAGTVGDEGCHHTLERVCRCNP